MRDVMRESTSRNDRLAYPGCCEAALKANSILASSGIQAPVIIHDFI